MVRLAKTLGRWGGGLVGFALVFLATYELVVLAFQIPEATISEMVWRTGDRYPVLKFLSGVLCGHFFWPRRAS
jgi:hypothetical protein